MDLQYLTREDIRRELNPDNLRVTAIIHIGLVVMILAAMGKYLDDYPILWLGAVPLLIHLAFGLLTFPTRGTVVDFMEKRILKPLQRKS